MKLHRLCDGVEVAATTRRKEKPDNHSQMPDLSPRVDSDADSYFLKQHDDCPPVLEF
jgi:hypothetical protein